MRRFSFVVLSGLVACAGPATQARPHSAASVASGEAPLPTLNLALASEPPLPGDDEGAWFGLEKDASAAATAREPPVHDADVGWLLARPLTVDAAVRISLLNNRYVAAAARDVDVALGLTKQAGLLPNPTVEAEKPIEPEVKSEWGVEYDLTHALLAPLRRHAAAAAVDAARVAAARTAIEISLEVREAFYGAQASEQKLAVAQRTLDALAAGRDAARALLDAGNVPALTLASQEAAYERARALVAQLELQRAESRERLQRVLGLSGQRTQWRLAGPMAAAPDGVTLPKTLEANAVEQNLELAELRLRMTGLVRQQRLATTQGWLPDVSVAVRMGELEHGAQARERRWAGGVAVTVPLFDRNQGMVQALGAGFRALNERHEALAVAVRSAAREARNRLVSAHARARQFHNVILPAQRRVTEQSLLQFNAMQVGVFQLLLARRDELDAELAAIETLREYWSAAAAFDAAMAGVRPRTTSAGALPSLNAAESTGAH